MNTFVLIPRCLRRNDDGTGPISFKRIEEIFVREGRIFRLRFSGYTILVTPEHPFFVRNQGWTAAGKLLRGDLLSTTDSKWLPVDSVEDTGETKRVYNFRVADYHTYFVAPQEADFGVWVHNAYHVNADAVTRDQGEQFRTRAQDLWDTLPEPNRYGATIGVTEVNGREVVSLYANVGSGRNQFSQAQVNDFLSSVEDAGGVAIHTFGNVHAEVALHQLYPTSPAIGISNPNGPCAALCGQYFAPREYYNLYWPGNRPAEW